MNILGRVVVFGGGIWFFADELVCYHYQADLIRKKEENLGKRLSAVMNNFVDDNDIYRKRAEYYYRNKFRRQRNTPMWLKVYCDDDLMNVQDIMNHEVYDTYQIYGPNVGIVATPSGKN